jgi:hypothetical protein
MIHLYKAKVWLLVWRNAKLFYLKKVVQLCIKYLTYIEWLTPTPLFPLLLLCSSWILTKNLSIERYLLKQYVFKIPLFLCHKDSTLFQGISRKQNCFLNMYDISYTLRCITIFEYSIFCWEFFPAKITYIQKICWNSKKYLWMWDFFPWFYGVFETDIIV